MYYLRQIHLPSGSDRQFPFSLEVLNELGTMTFDQPITVFVGENGSGKSTLLKALAIKLIRCSGFVIPNYYLRIYNSTLQLFHALPPSDLPPCWK
jgi:predicted ATPase